MSPRKRAKSSRDDSGRPRFNNAFNSVSRSFHGLLTQGQYQLPNYQRTYTWSKENIRRLLSDCLNGFYRMGTSGAKEPSEYCTFLGTTILLKVEKDFFKIIDGQQRITSLVLMACGLIEALDKAKDDVDRSKLKESMKSWLNKQISNLEERLNGCVRGTKKTTSVDSFSWPRIIKEGTKDHTGEDERHSEYDSPIAIFLRDFPEYASATGADEKPSFKEEAKHIKSNYEIMKQYADHLSSPETYGDPDESAGKDKKLLRLGCNMLEKENFAKAEMCSLLRIEAHGQDEKERINTRIGAINKSPKVSAALRLVLFGNYLLDYVGVGCITTQVEASALDIFDALNTTGEPLTALDTLKPLVVKYEDEREQSEGYESSEAQRCFDSIGAYLAKSKKKGGDEEQKDAAERQKDAADLTTSFALYMDGERLPRHLKDQREYLRERYRRTQGRQRRSSRRSGRAETAETALTPEKFVSFIAKFAECRETYWDNVNKDDMPGDMSEDAQLAMRFIRAANTSLTMPIISRYWIENERDKERLSKVIKALAAFLSLWRGFTGKTEGIDAEFRKLMKEPANNPLSLVSSTSSKGYEYNVIWDLQSLRDTLWQFLKDKIDAKSRAECKKKWVLKASEVPIYDDSRAVTRFLLLAAIYGAQHDGGGMLKKAKRGDYETEYWTYSKWTDENLKTIEHVAPQKKTENTDWDGNLYTGTKALKPQPGHTLGNLVLLPNYQNSIVANHGWQRKKDLYKAFAAQDIDQLEELKISAPMKKRLAETTVLSWLEFAAHVERWDEDFIKRRSKNLAGLAWDNIIDKWLKPSEDKGS